MNASRQPAANAVPAARRRASEARVAAERYPDGDRDRTERHRNLSAEIAEHEEIGTAHHAINSVVPARRFPRDGQEHQRHEEKRMLIHERRAGRRIEEERAQRAGTARLHARRSA
jgi:hypothetical protein